MIEWEKLSLTKEEEEAVEYVEEIPEERKEEIALSLLGKFLTSNTFSTKAMKTIMQAVWRPSRGMVIKELDRNLFLFQFFLKKDKDFVMKEGSWAFDGHLLITKEWTGTEQLSDIAFTTTGFWVKAYDVPAVRQTKAFAKFLGDKIGTFLGCDDDEFLGTGKALCFRTEVDVFKPLRRGVMVKLEGKALWIKFKYLKLPNFCYGCGVLGHTLKTCEAVDPATPACELQYGAWLRASPMKSCRRNAEMELAEERRLFTAFRSQRTGDSTRKRLIFSSGSTSGDSEKEHVVHMAIDEGEVQIPSGDVFKRKLGSMGSEAGCDKIRVVVTGAGKHETFVDQAGIARQPRQDQ